MHAIPSLVLAGLSLVCLIPSSTYSQERLTPAPANVRGGSPLAGTQPLAWDDDIASRLVSAADDFLLKELDRSAQIRTRHWHRDFTSPEAFQKSIEPNRQDLARIIGIRDPRRAFEAPELFATTDRPALVGRSDGADGGPSYEVYAIRWPVFTDVHGEGLLLIPTKATPMASVVAIPDADQTPEQIAGLADGVPPESQFARRLAESGCRVIVPVLIDRTMGRHRGAKLTSREFLYRSAFELGRHLIGYEVQKVLAAVDWFSKDPAARGRIGVFGWGEGGMIGLYAAAVDPRIDVTCISGYFDDRRQIWRGPIDRNVYGLLDQFGDAELASMIVPRTLIIEAARGPELELPGGAGAPARLTTPQLKSVQAEFERARTLVADLPDQPRPPQDGAGRATSPYLHLIVSERGTGPFGSDAALRKLLAKTNPPQPPRTAARPQRLGEVDSPARQRRQIDEIDRYNQRLLVQSADVRREFMKKLDTKSLQSYEASAASYRDQFYNDVIGRFDYRLSEPHVRSRLAYQTDKWVGYEVVMDVFEGLFAYGVLLLPRDLKEGEKRPVVVCQHGLEGRPQDVIMGDKAAYHDFAARLAERGFITFAPQNLYIFQDRFRTLQRKANPLKKSLFSIITPQHQQIINWLKTLPNVDEKRIAFYGLSYGGKTAMRVPALLTDYCLSICSADFNEWVWKNASTSSQYSYVWSGEYEIFEFDLGSTFNYAEMSALIAPRPFMVERGHFDGVAPDETVGYEFAKVRNLYEARLGIGDRCSIEWFVGPHTINGQGTFDFLHKFLNWPKR